MNEARLLVVVVVSSLLIFLFFSLVLGYEDNADISDVVRFSKSCAPGTVYNKYTGKCKDLVKSNKRLAERLQMLMPYFAAHTISKEE